VRDMMDPSNENDGVAKGNQNLITNAAALGSD
jgi:hypothetical protein